MYDTLLYHYQNNVWLLGIMLQKSEAFFFFLNRGFTLCLAGRCRTLVCVMDKLQLHFQVRLPCPGPWVDDGNNAQGGSDRQSTSLIWCDSKCSAGWQLQSFSCAHSRPDSLQDTPPSDRQHISRLDISSHDERSVGLRQTYGAVCE